MSKVFEKKSVVDSSEIKENPKVIALPQKTVEFIASAFSEQAKENILLEAEVAEKQNAIMKVIDGKLRAVIVASVASAGLEGNWSLSSDYKNLVRVEN